MQQEPMVLEEPAPQVGIVTLKAGGMTVLIMYEDFF
jgi:hypothetical protein